ncbi:adenosylcobinamide-GDP ribazoletransferase [Agrobacterium vitis]|uniref:adenosylcobinamide-GDP ribazoletransferase n=1 Tax=Agrobacterium vitis TaxID=373 RepID=UPI000872ADC2|nr:adenosylcobinamide-GDP ribazoletransferase [Agrobacterium vitis]MCE6077177.1 adenosylcobinamide-GDP ribazoletransferase [Agrobacterium vitis]MCM2452079.1 adenosylcobinamide-GDP ribazoletransferase [Agrobacterium vitis]MCM2469100.1 adenosylcobinamide-GDP ribazoletransferase [Agrobacterium vitis]MUO69498.1 adenosylcobinamide-GDP ribazoletransferase [Agrobacterium vitis]MUO87349.1 adenosylcobinamide-GDP ribazoletransferase [Agrobacterium vitis]
MTLTALVDDLARSLGFLSRLPIASRFFQNHSGEMSRTPRAFPLAGAVIAAPAGLLLALMLGLGASSLVAAFAALALQVLLTGALHEDGFADTADGLGGANREKAIDIMKDSRVGTFGVLALVFGVGMRVAALASLVNSLSPIHVALVMIGSAAVSRALMVWHWHALPPAKPDGVAASLGRPTDNTLYAALFLGLAVAVVTIAPVTSFHPLAVMLVASGAAAFAANRLILRKLGGQTGDTIGATQQICEITALASIAMAL